eukprot:jgi/Mesen1/7934/ME000422S07085
MLVDLASFSEETFDPKAWVNATCQGRPQDEPVEKHLSEIEMQLQLTAEDLGNSLEELSKNALLLVPRAVRETNRVRDDGLSLRGTVGGILQRLEQAEGSSAQSVAALARVDVVKQRMEAARDTLQAEGSSAQSVAALARVDVVKQRMEAARDTLQDAAGLAQLSASVEEVFASKDLTRVAETLASMRRCLAVVGEVPEFGDMKRQLATLEDRLQSLVKPELVEALSSHKVEATQKLRDILLAIGRYSFLEQQYTRTQLKPLRAKRRVEAPVRGRRRRRCGGVPFVDWLPEFYDEVLLTLEQEVRWCALAFPDEHHSLVPKLVTEMMAAISSSFLARLEAACQVASGFQPGRGPSHPATQLGALIALHGMTSAFLKNVQHLLAQAGTSHEGVAEVVRAIYRPFEGHKQRYGELERSQLSSELAVLDFRGAAPRGGGGGRGQEVSDTVRRIEVTPPGLFCHFCAFASVPEAMAAMEAAVERCMAFTGGSESEALLRALDDVMLQYLSQLLEVLRSLYAACGLSSGGAKGGSGAAGAADGTAAAATAGGGGGGGSGGASGGGGGVGLASSAAGKSPGLEVRERLGSRDRSRGRDADDDDDGDGDGGAFDYGGSGSGGGGATGGAAEEEDYALVQGALQLLLVAESLGNRASVFEASLRAALARLAARLMPAVVGGLADPSILQSLGGAALEGPAAEGGAGTTGGAESTGELGDALGARRSELMSAEAAGQGGSPRATYSPRAGAGGGGGGGDRLGSLDGAVLRLVDLPDKASRLHNLLEQARDPRFHALPRGAQRVQALQDAVHDLVYDMLVAKVRARLHGVARMPAWAAAEEENAFSLPSFSASPLPYITGVGEYLLTLPQQLEEGVGGLTGSGGGKEGGEEQEEDPQAYIATEWMFKVAEGAASLYVEQLRQIAALSERGTRQLAADTDYLCNILSALYIAPPPPLGTFQLCTAVPRAELAKLVAEEGGPEGSLDPPTARLIAKMRQVSLD